MSWLFGKKKHHKDSPPDSTEDEHMSYDQDDKFVIVGSPNPPFLPTQGASNNPFGGNNIYPSIPGIPHSTIPTNLPKQNQLGDQQHYLSRVPFKLCKQLQNTLDNDIDTDVLRISEILSFIEQIESQNYNYDFVLEKSVITEIDSRKNE